MDREFLQFHETLEDDDYGIIIGKDGTIKGMWVPKDLATEEDFPDTIARLVFEHFGVDPNDESVYHTLH